MRCYFHLIGPAETLLDETGQDVSDIVEAERAIFELINELFTDDPSIADRLKDWRMNVVNHSGSTVLDLDLRAILAEIARIRRDI